MPKPLNVLILEDNPIDAELMLLELRRAGFEPDWQLVDNEKDFAARLKPELDLILSDYYLPQFTGQEALHLLNESGFDIPCIVVSGEINEELAMECMRAGADDYLMKDRLRRLGAAVNNSIKKKVARDEKQQAQHEIMMLLDLSRQAGAETNLNDLLFFIADQIVKIIPPAEAASIFFYDKERKVFKVQAWAGFKDSDIKELEFEVDGSLVGRFFHTRKPALIKDVSLDPDFKPSNKPSRSSIKSQIIVPLFFKERVFGVLFADNLTRTNAFSQKNLDLLESVGNQLAGMIENMRLLDQAGQSEKRLSKAQQIGHIGFIERNLKTNQCFLSDEVYAIHGFKPQEGLLTHELIMKAIHPDDREFVQESIDSLIRDGAAINIDHRIVLPGGEVRWVNKQVEITSDVEGGPGTMLATVLDISERKRYEQELIKSERCYKEAESLAHIGHWDYEPIGEKLSWSEETYSIFEVDKDAQPLSIEKVLKYVHPQDREILRGQVGKGESYRSDYRIVTDNGSVKHMHEEVLIERHEDGRIITMRGTVQDVTGRMQAEHALRESEEQYRSLFNSMLNGFALHEIICDDAGKPIDYRFVEVNPAFESLTGLGAAEIVGKTALEVLPKLEPVWIENYGKVALTGEPFLFEQYTQELDKHFEIFAFSPKKNQFATVFSDVSERKAFTRELQQERDKAQKYLDIAGVMIVALNKESEITLVNQKGAGILGYQVEELIGKNWFDTVIPKRDRENGKKRYINLMTGEEQIYDQFEETIVTRSGEERIIDWHGTLLREWGKEKHIIGILSSGEDITERKQAEQQNRKFSKIIETTSQSVIITNIKGTVSYVNQSYYDFSGFVEDEVIGKSMYRFANKKGALKLAKEVIPALIRNKHWQGEMIVVKKNKKSVPVELNCSLLPDEKNKPEFFVAVLSDLTERVQAEHILRKSEQKLRSILDSTIHLIAATVEVRDPYTAGHQTRVADLSAAIASEMCLSEEQVEGIRIAGMIHDLGKIYIPSEILSRPGKISELEYEIIKTHSQVGFDLLKDIEFPWPIARMVHQHHERMDGSGYPQGLKGDEILLEARILAVADVVEAMSSHRPYRPALGVEKALEQIRQDKGTLLDSRVVDACCKVFGQGYKLPEG